MMKIKVTLILFLICKLVFGQNPLVKMWDQRFGGTDIDRVRSFQQTNDGGYILGGDSYSPISGDKTQNSRGAEDYWIIKLDGSGTKKWDKRFGGDVFDYLYSLQQTSDGGYILGGYSNSDNNGDKSQPDWDSTQLTSDYWIVKTDSLGNKEWDKRFGGTKHDYLFSLQQTADGGYILGGWSSSQISGDKTQNNWDSLCTPVCITDYWIVKTDSMGTKQWDKRFGGTLGEVLKSLRQTADGGYILGGWSGSGISGDKTQPNWDTTLNTDDYWIVKTDSSGNKQWDWRYGGTGNDLLYSITQTADRGYLLGGYSTSGISGNKTQANWDTICSPSCYSDYWVVKTDSSGNKQWDKCYGGLDSDIGNGNIFQTADGGFLIAGYSANDSSGDKTENNLGVLQTWVIKTDSLGVKQWDKTLHTNCIYPGPEDFGLAIQTIDGCYAMVNYTNGGVAGDKTQPNWDTMCFSYCTSDYWILKFCDTTLTTNITPTLSKGEGVVIAPNPFTDEITITLQKQNIKQATFTIKNILGQTVYSRQPETRNQRPETTIDLSFLSKGIYLLEVTVDGVRTVKKIVKE